MRSKEEIRSLTFPNLKNLAHMTFFVMAASIVATAVITADTLGVSKLCAMFIG